MTIPPNQARAHIHAPEGVRKTKNVYKGNRFNLRPDQLQDNINWLAIYKQEVKWGRG